MKKIELFSGGHRFRADDLSHMQTGIVEGFQALGRGLANTYGVSKIILDGCVINQATPGTASWTSGWVFMNDEVFYIPGGSLTGLPLFYTLYFREVETAAAPSPVTYQDASVHDVHLVRELTLVANPGVVLPTDAIVSSVGRVSNLVAADSALSARITSIESGWYEQQKSVFSPGELQFTWHNTATTTATTTSDWTTGALSCRWKIIGKTIHITFSGYMTGGPYPADSTFGRTQKINFTMPSSFTNLFMFSNTPFLGSAIMGHLGNQDKYPCYCEALPNTNIIQVKLCYIPKNMTDLGNSNTYIYFETPSGDVENLYFKGGLTAEIQ